jgi:hypothetical protein
MTRTARKRVKAMMGTGTAKASKANTRRTCEPRRVVVTATASRSTETAIQLGIATNDGVREDDKGNDAGFA